ncbi:MAG TPA: hypothetical protein VGM39_10575 [Kofleriaceae bacterium]|jgi:hypothetical protein
MRRFLLGLTISLAACAGTSAEAPLTLKLGTPHDQALEDFKKASFCPKIDGPAQQTETYPRCERAGTEWGDAWVTAKYDNGKLLEVRRWERYDNDDHAVERWNKLVSDRMHASPDATDAGDLLRARGPLEPGTRSVKAFLIDSKTIVAVYLLTPSPPENASVLEAIMTSRPGAQP